MYATPPYTNWGTAKAPHFAPAFCSPEHGCLFGGHPLLVPFNGKPTSHLLSGWPKKSSNFTCLAVFPKSLKFMNRGSEQKETQKKTRQCFRLLACPHLFACGRCSGPVEHLTHACAGVLAPACLAYHKAQASEFFNSSFLDNPWHDMGLQNTALFLQPPQNDPSQQTEQTRPRLARKQNIASEVGPTLQDAFFFPTLREASARQHQARCSAQTGRCKLVCASCSTQVALCKLQVAPCKLLCANCAPCKLLCASCSVQVALCKLLCVSCSAQVALGKALCANWSVQVGLRKLLCATCSAQVALRKLLKKTNCILRRPPADQGGIEPATRRFREQAREPRDNSRGPVRTTKVAKNLEFLHLDHADSRRGSREHCRNRKKP